VSAPGKRARALTNYAVEVQHPECVDWTRILTDARGRCEGYFDCYREQPGPRLAVRVVRIEPLAVHSLALACDHVSIGWHAGSPTAEQYRAAGDRAHAQADAIDAATARRAALRGKPCG